MNLTFLKIFPLKVNSCFGLPVCKSSRTVDRKVQDAVSWMYKCTFQNKKHEALDQPLDIIDPKLVPADKVEIYQDQMLGSKRKGLLKSYTLRSQQLPLDNIIGTQNRKIIDYLKIRAEFFLFMGVLLQKRAHWIHFKNNKYYKKYVID